MEESDGKEIHDGKDAHNSQIQDKSSK